MISGEQVPIFVAAGASALALSSLLWALRVSEGARGAAKRFREKATKFEEKLARADSVFGAHPGVILVWDAEDILDDDDMGEPAAYGSPVALAGMLRFTDEGVSPNPAVRILEGLADLEARDGSGADTTLRVRMRDLRENGAPFSLTIIGPSGRFLEADGRTAGARAVLWLTDSTIKGLEESSARGRLEEARQVVARDPTAFLDMLDKAPFPAWRVSGTGALQWANRHYLKAVDLETLDQALDRQSVLDQYVAEQARKTIEQNKDIDETRLMAINGQKRSMRILTFPLSGGAGGMAFDITDEKSALESLDKHVRAHDETLNHVADGVAIFGADRKLMFHNKAFADLWGLDESFLLEEPTHGQILDRLRERRLLPYGADYAAWRAEELGYYQGIRGVAEDLWALPAPDSRTLKVTRQRHPLGGLLVLFKDISSEMDLRARYNELINTQGATLDNLHEAVSVFGGDGRLKLVNHSFYRLWNIDAGTLKDAPDYDQVVEKCLPMFHDRGVWDSIKGRITNPSPEVRQDTTGEMHRSDGSVVTYLTQPLPDGATLVAFVDVSASRRVEEALRERAEAFEAADRLKTEFVQNVSYQLRSPLTTIIGYAEFLQSERNGDLNDRQSDFVGSILTASDHLSKLIENILDLAMIEAGRMDLELSDVDLASVVRDSVEMVVSNAADTQVAVSAQIQPGIGTIQADERRIRQILFNLVSNALRFTDHGDKITVKAEKEQGIVRLTVTDTGKGIDYEKQAGSFDTFNSGDQRGAGLGLALVRSFVELHGGWVAIQSEPGEGASVICVLPDSVASDGKPERPFAKAA